MNNLGLRNARIYITAFLPTDMQCIRRGMMRAHGGRLPPSLPPLPRKGKAIMNNRVLDSFWPVSRLS